MSLKKPITRRNADSPAAPTGKPGPAPSSGSPPPPKAAGDRKSASGKAPSGKAAAGKAAAADGSKKSSKKGSKSSKDSKSDAEGKSMSNDRKRALLAAGAAATLTIFGVLLLVSYVKGNDTSDAAAGAVESRQILVVKEPISSGTTLSELLDVETTSLQTEFVPVDHIAQGSIANRQQLEDLGDVMVNVDLAPGEQLLVNRFVSRESFSSRAAAVAIPDGHHQVSFALSPTRSLGGLIRAGDDISVVASFNAHEDLGNISAIILPSVEVINVQTDGEVAGSAGSTNPDAVNSAPTGNYLITVAVEPAELTKLSYAIDYGQIMVAAAPGVGSETQTVVDEDGDGGTVTTMANVLDVVVPSDNGSPSMLAFDDSGLGDDVLNGEENGEADDSAAGDDGGSRTRYGGNDATGDAEAEGETEQLNESSDTTGNGSDSGSGEAE